MRKYLMEVKISPFSTTPGIAGDAYINPGYADEIIANFECGYSTQYVYKILGLRGSGKSVEYKRVMDYFSGKDGWKVYGLPSGGTPLETLVSALGREPETESYREIRETETQENIEGGIAFAKGGLAARERRTVERKPEYYNAAEELKNLCRQVSRNGYRILIGIDDIAATAPMIEFLSILNDLLLDSRTEIRLLATGLEKNVEDFFKMPHLSFFARPKPFIVTYLNLHDVERMYLKLLDVTPDEAHILAGISGGYAWGYQLLGDEYFHKKKEESMDDVLQRFDLRIASTYDLIWGSVTKTEKEFIRTVLSSETGKSSEIAEKVKGFSQNRQNLKKKHIIDTSEPGILRIQLPRFREYVLDN